MKYRYPVILVVFVTLIAMVVSGCTSASPSTTSTSVVSPSIAPSASTPTTSGGNTGTLGSLYQVGNFKSYDYNLTSSIGVFDTQYKYDIATFGDVSNARHLQNNLTTSGYTETWDLYYDGTKFLGGQRKYLHGTQVLAPKDFGGENIDNAIEMSRAGALYTISNDGQETVTVPAGTFVCTKYTVNDGPYAGTFWEASGVPVPVKVVLTDAMMGNLELISWG
jgi:hypothetical protein